MPLFYIVWTDHDSGRTFKSWDDARTFADSVPGAQIEPVTETSPDKWWITR